MTEEEAKMCWCPMARVWDLEAEKPVPHNRLEWGRDESDMSQAAHCLGSACMAWRWTGKTNGYCGLAGAPGREP